MNFRGISEGPWDLQRFSENISGSPGKGEAQGASGAFEGLPGSLGELSGKVEGVLKCLSKDLWHFAILEKMDCRISLQSTITCKNASRFDDRTTMYNVSNVSFSLMKT